LCPLYRPPSAPADKDSKRSGDAARSCRQLLDRLAQASQEREELERALAATPPETDIRPALDRFKTASQNVTLLNEQAQRLKAAEEQRRAELKECVDRLQRLAQG
jgi:septal ring factor EnvC (AmiA/AmiB activator)